MNTREILNELAKLFSNFIMHKRFIKELKDLLSTKLRGKEASFFDCLATQLRNIKDFGVLVDRTDKNEKIKGFDGHYYSIHLQKSQFNVRLLVYINDDSTPFFLCAFYEEEGKKRTSYSHYTSTLETRYNELLGGGEDERQHQV